MARQADDDSGKAASKAYWNARRYVANKANMAPVTVSGSAKGSFEGTVDQLFERQANRGEDDFSDVEVQTCIHNFIEMTGLADDLEQPMEAFIWKMNRYFVEKFGLIAVSDKPGQKIPSFRELARYIWLLSHFLKYLKQQENVRVRNRKDVLHIP